MTKAFSRICRIAIALALLLSPLPLTAQTVATTFDELIGKLKPGDTVSATDETKRETRGQIVELATSALVLTTVMSQTNEPRSQAGSPGSVNGVSPTSTPRIEIFGGYSYLPGPETPSAMEAGHGFALALDVNVGPHFGVRADFDANFFARRAERAPDALGGYELTPEDITLYYYSVGPTFVQRWKHIDMFAAGLLEGQTSRWDGLSLAKIGKREMVDVRVSHGQTGRDARHLPRRGGNDPFPSEDA